MADFTMQLKEVIEAVYGTEYDADEYEQSYGSITFDGVMYGRLPILNSYNEIGLGTYPIFNESYRQILNGKIIDEYYNREIGMETIDDFKFSLRRKMDQIMPYYNQMYLSTQIDYSALQTMEINSVGSSNMTGEETAKTKNVTDTDTKSGSRGINSNFPQTILSGNGDYATSGNDLNSLSNIDVESNTDAESTNSNTNNSNSKVTGFQGVSSELVNRYRNSLINVDTMVLAEIEDCFMFLSNNGDEYFAHESRYGWY